MTSTRALGRLRSGVGLDLLWAALLGCLVLSALGGFGLDGGRDWDEFQADLLSARRALLGGELPFWMPYRGGGHDAWADPQSVWCSPLGALVLAFGLEWGCRLFAAACAATAALGGARLVGWLGGGAEARLVTAAVLGLAPPLAMYMAAGVPTYMLGYAVLPWIVLGVARPERWGVALAAGGFAVLLYGGGINHVVFHGLFLGAWSAALAWRQRRAGPVWRFVGVGLVAMGLAAPKLLPALDLARRHPRPVDQAEVGRGAVTWGLLPHLVLDRELAATVARPRGEFVGLGRDGRFLSLIDAPGPGWVQPETAIDSANAVATAGWVVTCLAGFGLLGLGRAGRPTRARSRAGPALLASLPAAALMLWVAWGRNATPSVWALLTPWPVFDSLRSPDKAMLYVFFALALWAGFGAAGLLRRGLPRRDPRCLGLALVLGLVSWELHPPARLALRQTFCEPPRELRLDAPGFRQMALPPQDWGTRYGPPVLPAVRAGVGLVNGYATAWIRPHALPQQHPAYGGEAWAPGREAAFVRVSARTVAARVGPGPATVLGFNQNAEPGWAAVSPAGARVGAASDGRLQVALPADEGEQRVVLRYTPPWLGTGLLVFVLTLAGLGRYVRSSS